MKSLYGRVRAIYSKFGFSAGASEIDNNGCAPIRHIVWVLKERKAKILHVKAFMRKPCDIAPSSAAPYASVFLLTDIPQVERHPPEIDVILSTGQALWPRRANV